MKRLEDDRQESRKRERGGGGWRNVASDVGLLLREVDLISEAQSHPLRKEGRKDTCGFSISLFVYIYI